MAITRKTLAAQNQKLAAELAARDPNNQLSRKTLNKRVAEAEASNKKLTDELAATKHAFENRISSLQQQIAGMQNTIDELNRQVNGGEE